ncbi:hypothetical protein AB0G74_12085 [Streptomyces sp. NPDC020875]|uniref:hypothetical protein n=1 Tax=Streptomyces sp. NPDC020875 TaxID=3154898 RepID=UPI0034102971
MTNSTPAPAFRDPDFTLAQLRGDCVRMAPHWPMAARVVPAPVPPSSIRGVVVPPVSVRLVGGLPGFG